MHTFFWFLVAQKHPPPSIQLLERHDTSKLTWSDTNLRERWDTTNVQNENFYYFSLPTKPLLLPEMIATDIHTKKYNCIHSLHVNVEAFKIDRFLGMVNHPLRNWCSGRSTLFVATSWWSSNSSQLLSCCLIGVTSWGQDREKSPCHCKACSRLGAV